MAIACSLGAIDALPAATATAPATSVIATYRVRIPQLMAEQHIPGLAIAVVDRDRTLWVQGFGHLDGAGSDPVTPDTIFSAQSMSKLFTATAVMRAAQAGLVDLDAPITRYLPGFTVHSAFEKHPERKITLRMLLSHTAGFTHEAPVGNNNELDPGNFDTHVRSISDTWLRFPVGSGVAYSNLGIDLAGYILQRVEGKAFPQLMRDSLLAPLGMNESTFDRAAIRASTNRAVGHLHPYPKPPLYVPMTAAGGLYTSATDLARFLHFELNGGSINGRVVLEPEWVREQRRVPPPHEGAPAGYALGVQRHRWNRWEEAPDLFEHGGGGYGFLSDIWWAPRLGIGAAVLTNSQDHQLQNVLSLSILTDLLSAPGVYQDRLDALPIRPGAEDPNIFFDPPAGMAKLVAKAAVPAGAVERSRWATYSGLYRMPAWGYVSPKGLPDQFLVDRSVPYFKTADNADAPVRHRLVEVEKGVFLADNGETLDLRGAIPTWRNLRLVRVSGGPAAWQWAILGASALVALVWLLGAALRSVQRRGGRHLGTTLVACATALIILGNVTMLVWLPGLVDSGFLGDLDLTPAERLMVHLPLAVTVTGAAMVVLSAYGWARRWWPRPVALQYAALAAAAIAVAPLLAAWHLIGLSVS